MRRREFIVMLGGAALWPLAANAQSSPGKPARVVMLSPADTPALNNLLRAQLRDLGYVEGRNIHLDLRSAGGHVDRLPQLASALVQESDISAIVAESTPAAQAAQQATSSIPIVAFVAVDPVASGLAKSLAHPGSNVTGIAIFAEETNVKRVELMREVAPRAVRLGAIAAGAGKGELNLGPVKESGGSLGFSVEIISVDDPADLARALSPAILADFDGFVVVPDIVLSTHRTEVIKLIGLSKKPAIFTGRDWVESGGLMSFGPNIIDAHRHLVSQLDRVLKGAHPRDLPFERPTKLELVINLLTARGAGIELSPSLLARADEVIE
jgi:putative tryptophan/tyrosine transport system substrate-binding protein